LTIPLLIMHGGADRGVNPSQSLTIAQKLQSLGKTYELIIYAGDGHRLARKSRGSRPESSCVVQETHETVTHQNPAPKSFLVLVIPGILK
jgi:dienelactone hydrolase